MVLGVLILPSILSRPKPIFLLHWASLAGKTQISSITPPQFHLRPSTTSILLDIRDAPNLTATLEGPLFEQQHLTP